MNIKWVCRDGTDNHEWNIATDICNKCGIESFKAIWSNPKPSGLKSGAAIRAIELSGFREREMTIEEYRARKNSR